MAVLLFFSKSTNTQAYVTFIGDGGKFLQLTYAVVALLPSFFLIQSKHPLQSSHERFFQTQL